MKTQIGSRWLRRFAVAVGLSLVLSLAWADQPQGKAKAKETQKKTVAARTKKDPIRVTQHFFAIAPGGDYIIGPQDVLAINVWKEPEISRAVPVRPDGKISLPLVGDIVASGLTPMQLEKEISDDLKAYIANPEVVVIVQVVNSRKFNIVGEIARPGSYSLTKQMTVLDAIAQAGGPRDFAKVKKIYVLRQLESGEHLRILFNYKDIIRGRNFHQNVELQPGDTIVVP